MLINLGLHALVWAVLLSPQSLPIHLALVGRKPSKVINKYYFIIGTAISFCLEKHNNYVSCNISADLFEVMILGLLNIRPKEILSTPSKCQTFNVLVYHTNIFFSLKSSYYDLLHLKPWSTTNSNVLNFCALKIHMAFLSAVIIVYEHMILTFLNYVN